MFNKILLPTDFSKHGQPAVKAAIELAKTHGASLHLLHIYPLPGMVYSEGFIPAGPEAMTNALNEIEGKLSELTKQAKDAGVATVESCADAGHAFAGILGYAKKHGADLIVMGTHGRSGLAHALLGSVAEKVVRKAACPVLTVRSPEHKFQVI